MDPAATLGLSIESVYGYSISHIKRVLDSEPPELPPCRRGVTSIAVTLKGITAVILRFLLFWWYACFCFCPVQLQTGVEAVPEGG